MIRERNPTLGMSMAAMPLLRMQSQTITLDLLNRISESPSCEIAEVADEDWKARNSAMAIVLQIANQSPNSYLNLVNWTSQKPSCEIVEITRSGNKSDAQKPKSRLKQLVERIWSLVASMPPFICMIYIFREECRKVKELQDKCIAIERDAILKNTWWNIWNTCQSAANYISYVQCKDIPTLEKQQACERSLMRHWQTCTEILDCAKERCEIIEKIHRRERFRPSLIHNLKFLQEHLNSA